MRCADKDFGAERPLVTTGERLECSQLEDFPGFSWKKNATEHQQLALSVIAPNVVSRELLGSAKELEKLSEL